MNRMLSVLMAMSIVVGGGVATVHAQAMAPGKTITVTGTLIDTKCYSMDHRNKGVDHQTPHGEMKDCAKLCARLGIPVAILTGGDEVVTLVTPAQDLVEHMGQTARVTGARVYGNQVRPDKIEVKDATGKWSEIKITMPISM